MDKIMNVELVNPATLVAAPTGPNAGGRGDLPGLARRHAREVAARA